jgi:hypothetical protein
MDSWVCNKKFTGIVTLLTLLILTAPSVYAADLAVGDCELDITFTGDVLSDFALIPPCAASVFQDLVGDIGLDPRLVLLGKTSQGWDVDNVWL